MAVRAPSTQSGPAEATKVCTMKVTGMTCSGCEAAVKIAAKQIDGVKDAKASYAKGTADITYDSTKTSPDAIAKAIARGKAPMPTGRPAPTAVNKPPRL